MTVRTEQPPSMIGPYRVVGALGEGAMGQVWKAVNPRTGEFVAIKALNPHLWARLNSIERFQREFVVLLQLRQHPHIVTVLEHLQEPPAIVMEHLDGQTLQQRVASRGAALDWPEVQRLFRQVLEAVGYAHGEGVLHRDIKSANVMVVRLAGQDHVKVMDFGLAGVAAATELTQAGTRMGTLTHMAPELHRGLAASPASDIYALGVMLHELVTGSVPFWVPGMSEYALIQCHMESPLPRLRTQEARIPAGTQGLIDRATAKCADDRFASVQAMLTAFDHLVAAGRPHDVPQGAPETLLESPVVPAPVPHRSHAPSRRRFPTWMLAVSLVAVGLAVGLVWRPTAPVSLSEPPKPSQPTRIELPPPSSAAPQPAVQAPTPETVEQPSYKAKPQFNEFMDAWVGHQTKGNFGGYAASYHAEFVGVKRTTKGKTTEFGRQSWLEDRRKMFGRAHQVHYRNLKIRPADNPDEYVLHFTQYWASARYADKGPKELVVRFDNGKLRILREEMLHSHKWDRRLP